MNLGNVRDDIGKIDSHYKDAGYFLVRVTRQISQSPNCNAHLFYWWSILDEIITEIPAQRLCYPARVGIGVGKPLNDNVLGQDLEKFTQTAGKLEPNFYQRSRRPLQAKVG